VNRKTFYYHFEDIYALLKWTLDQEAVEVVKQLVLMVDYREAILFVIDYVDTNKHILNCAYNSMGAGSLKRFFCADFIGILRTVVDNAEKNQSLHVSEDFKAFLSTMYAEALAGILVDWFRDKTSRDREKTLQYISLILKASLPRVIAAAAASDC
jgi:AcrR family transcriptional regulator